MGEETGRCRFEIWTGSRSWLLPPSLDELLPLDHPARFVAVFVDALDKEGWAELGVEINGDPLGAPAYHPRALLCVWLYGFMTGVRSCRKLEAACRDSDTVFVADRMAATGPQHLDGGSTKSTGRL